MKVQCSAKHLRAVAIVGTVTALLLLAGTHTGAQGAQVYNLVSVCVNQNTGAMRMVLKASPLPANCSPAEQFIQLVQTPPGSEQTAGPRASNGSNSDHGFWELAGRHGEAAITGGGTAGDSALRRVAYYESEGSGADSGSGAGNQAQATQPNSGAGIPQNQSGAYGPNGTYVPSGAGNQAQGTGGNAGASIPPNQRGAYGPNGNFVAAPGDTGTTLYAPLIIKDRATGKMLAKIYNNGKGGRLELGNANAEMVAAIGTSLAGTGSVGAYNAGMVIGFGYPPNSVYGAFQMYSSGKKIAELGPGKEGQMGLRIFNPAGIEVVTLENLPSAPFGGGLQIHNAAGGAVAWITPNSDGTLGVVHALTVPMPVP